MEGRKRSIRGRKVRVWLDQALPNRLCKDLNFALSEMENDHQGPEQQNNMIMGHNLKGPL